LPEKGAKRTQHFCCVQKRSTREGTKMDLRYQKIPRLTWRRRDFAFLERDVKTVYFLRIKSFYGYSENAVRTQLWIAVAVYCLLAIIKKELKADRELHEIQEILSVSVFQKMPVLQAFSKVKPKSIPEHSCNQFKLFEL
jgi:hypothetical protein